MYQDSKLSIYQGVIQYLLDNTNYNLEKIASFSNCSIKNFRTIYSYNSSPPDLALEINLIRLPLTILEIEKRYRKQKLLFPHGKERQFSNTFGAIN